MKVLVTGASGFVGSAVLKHLAYEGHEVWGAYRHGVLRRAAEGFRP